jgi:hypothetical protein
VILLSVLLACAPPNPLESLDERYSDIMVDLGVAERDTARNIHNKEARRRRVKAESERVAFFQDPSVISAIDAARKSDDAVIRAKGDAYHRDLLRSLGWTADDKHQEERLVRELEEARGQEALWNPPEGKPVALSQTSWPIASRDGDAYTEEDRRELAQQYVDHQMDIVAKRLQELVKLRNDVARRAGYPNYWELALESEGLTPARVDALVDELSAVVVPIQTEVAARIDATAKELGIANTWANRPLLRRKAGLEAGRDEVDPFADSDRVEEVVTTALQDMGITTEGWQVYTGPSRIVRSGVYSFPIRPPRYVAVVLSTDTRWSIRTYQLLAHEAGHLVWWTNLTPQIAKSPPMWEPPPPWSEGFGGFFEHLVSTPSFLEKYLPELPADKRDAFAQWSPWADVEEIARDIVGTVVERRLYEDPNNLEAITRVGAELEQKLYATPDLPLQASSGVYYTSTLVSNIPWNYPAYRPAFLSEAKVEAEIASAVEAAVGDPVGNPATGPFLVSKLIRGSPEQSFEERLKALVPGSPTDALKAHLRGPPAASPPTPAAPDATTADAHQP